MGKRFSAIAKMGTRCFDHRPSYRFDAVKRIETMPLSVGDSSFDWEFVDPCIVLPQVIDASGHLAALYGRALAEHPCREDRPWTIIITWDEFCPGAKLKVDNRRKCMDLSMNFRELGPAALSQDWTWLTPICVRSCKIREVRGGWPHMLKRSSIYC